ncbi:MAG: hydrogen peroxide-inducible genes activator [Pseudomonadota bacterium]
MTNEARPTVKQLQCFVAASEQDSFRRAADRMGVTQPTLTAQIDSLENALGALLFERSRTGSRLSPLGRELVPTARRVLEEIDGFVQLAIDSQSGPAGTYRLGVPPTLGPYLLPHILPDLHARYGDLQFFVREEAPAELEHGLDSGRYDLILTPLPLNSENFQVTHLFREPVKLVVPGEHALASLEEIGEEDLRGQHVLTIEEHHLFHRQIGQLCERLGARMRRDYEGTSLDTLRQMAVMGMGVAFLPALYIASEIREGSGLSVVAVPGAKEIDRIHAIAWRATSPSRALFKTLADEIRECVARRLKGVVAAIN